MGEKKDAAARPIRSGREGSPSPEGGDPFFRIRLLDATLRPPRALPPFCPRAPQLEGKEFFRQARARLSYEDFSLFLGTIKELNSHRLTRDEAMRKASAIFGPSNRELYVAFEGLLSRHLPI